MLISSSTNLTTSASAINPRHYLLTIGPIRYSGEFSERLWVHTFQMINYLLLDQPEGAAIEARRAVALYEEHGNVLQNDLFTRT